MVVSASDDLLLHVAAHHVRVGQEVLDRVSWIGLLVGESLLQLRPEVEAFRATAPGTTTASWEIACV